MRVWTLLRGFALACALIQTAQPARAATVQVGATDLLASSERAYNATLAAARQNGQLDPSNPRNAPFWSTLARMGQSLQTVRNTLVGSDPRVFQALRDGSRTLAELRVSWSRTGTPAPAVEANLTALASSYRLLRTGYGREGLREQQGSAMAEQERQWLARWQDSQRRLAEQLRLLVAVATERGDFDTVAELQPILEDAERISEGEPTLDTFLDASLASDTAEGEWEGLSEQLSQQYEEEWQTVDAIIDEISAESEMGFVLAANLGEVAAYLDEKGEIVDDALEKVDDAGEPLDAIGAEPVVDDGSADGEKPLEGVRPPDWEEIELPSRDFSVLPGAEPRFRLFAGPGEPETAFHLWSPRQRALPAAFWLELAAGKTSTPTVRRGR